MKKIERHADLPDMRGIGQFMPPMANVKAGLRKVKAQQVALRRAKKALRRARRNRGCGVPFWKILTQPWAIDRAVEQTQLSMIEEQLTIVAPEKLNFADDIVPTLRFFSELRAILLGRGSKKVVNIDTRNLADVQPDAALVLIADLYYAHYNNPGCKKVCHFPKDLRVRELLWDVGYFKYFPKAKNVQPPQQTASRYYLRHQFGSSTKGTIAKELILHFEKMVEFGPGGRGLLYSALIECMNNVAEHAYPLRWRYPKTYMRWWLLGYFDIATKEISFCFFDQGVGIPKTIRTKLRDYIRNGSKLIARAVEQGMSSTGLRTKGKGLPSLRHFVDASAEGQLSIVSSRSQCIFPKAGSPVTSEYPLALYGTLITWNIKPGGLNEGEND